MIPALALLSALSVAAPSAPPPPDSLVAAAALAPTRSSVALTTPYRVAPPRADPQVIEYSDAYFTRLTIHRWASYLTLPLFAGQYVVGQKLVNGEGSDRLRGIHGALAGGIAGLFAINTVTGGLNMIEARKDPEGKNRRTLHTALMLLADAGFVATGMLAGESESEDGWYRGSSNNQAHRNVALASMGTALVGYAVMLPIFGRR